MTVDDVIAALSALPAEQRACPLVLAVPPYGMAAEVREVRYQLPPEPADIRYMPAPDAEGEVLIAAGLVMLVTLSECSPQPETCSTSADA